MTMATPAASDRAARGTTGPAPQTGLALEVRGLTVSYGNKPVLRYVNLDVPRGQVLAVVGPNGAGKSTLLKALLGLVPIDSGTIRVFGRPAAQARGMLAYVPQTETVDWDFPITAGEVVLMGRYGRLGLLGRPSRADWQIAQDCLRTVGMSELADRHIRDLSGGQQQRVFLARALAQQAPIMLLDEPLAGVDARTEETLFELMGGLAAQGKTLVVVNHNLQVLDRFDCVLLLNQVVIACGPPAQVITEANLRATYGGRISYLDEAERELHEGPPDVR